MIVGKRLIGVYVHIHAKSQADFEEIANDIEKEFIKTVMKYKPMESAKVNVYEKKTQT